MRAALGRFSLRIERLLTFLRIKDGRDPVHQLGGRVASVGDGQDFVRPGGFAANEMSDAARQHRGLARPGAGDHQHRTVHVLDGLTLLVSRDESVMAVAGHWKSRLARRKGEDNIIRDQRLEGKRKHSIQ